MMTKTPVELAGQVVFKQISTTDSISLAAALHIYEQAFPPNERHATETITERVEHGKNLLYTGSIHNEIVFMALLWPLQHTPFILLDYMATHPLQQGKKIGSFFLQHMKTLLEKHHQYFILEAEDPLFGLNKKERQKRIAFYRKNGARQLQGVQYILPALQGKLTTQMVLMVFPGYSNQSIEGKFVKHLIVQIYKELYNRTEEEALAAGAGYSDQKPIALT